MDKIKNLINEKDYQYDISFIMQSYINEEVSWKNSESFLLSVESFINLNDPRAELIIVSDGCNHTHRAYFDNFKNEKNIKYIFLDKKSNHISDLPKKRFRGLPREIGRSMASGYITTYLDSDDRLMSNASHIIRKAWNNTRVTSNIEVIFQTECFRHISEYSSGGLCDPSIWGRSNDNVQIDELNGKWAIMWLKGDKRAGSTWTITHLSDCNARWNDTDSCHEDHAFCKALMKSDNYLYFGEAYYVIINDSSSNRGSKL
jgi:hypothetical protein